MDRADWWATVHRVTKSRKCLSDNATNTFIYVSFISLSRLICYFQQKNDRKAVDH